MLARKKLRFWSVAFLSLIYLTSAKAEVQQLYFIINAHGGKTSNEFVIPSSVNVYTPTDLAIAYSYRDDGADLKGKFTGKGIENIFAAGQLPGYSQTSSKGHWKRYSAGRSVKMPEVKLAPLNFVAHGTAGVVQELKYLSSNMASRTDHWSYDTGDDSVLFVRKNKGIEKIIGHEAIKRYIKEYVKTLNNGALYDKTEAPIILVVSKENKVKVLAQTSLSEVASLLNNHFAKPSESRINILLAACNIGETQPQTHIVLSTKAKKATSISDLLPK